MHLVALRFIRLSLFIGFMLFICGLEIDLSAQADSGSAQSTMSLYVPPNEFNTMPQQANKPYSQSASYDSDTQTAMLQKTEGVTYEIWMEL